MRTRLVLVGLAFSLLAACSGGGDDRSGPTTVPAPPFSIGLWGDAPYTAEQLPGTMAMIADMNAAGLAFSVFDGDIKGGATCDDRYYTEALARFQAFTHPLVYVPGDNEWTDCQTGGHDPRERLDHLRRTFFASPAESLGQRRMPLEHQETPYVENTRWQMGGVVFVGLHVPGSNNGKVDDPVPPHIAEPANAEFRARDAANKEWLTGSFALARRVGAAGVMVVIQANPGFEAPANLRPFIGIDGFDSFLAVLRDETIRFRKPVALVHGDTHTYRLDRPMRDARGRPVPNFVRCETFGYPDVSWVKATVDQRDPNLFRFEPQRLY